MPNPEICIDVFPVDREEARATTRALAELLGGDRHWRIRITTNYGEVRWRVDVDRAVGWTRVELVGVL